MGFVDGYVFDDGLQHVAHFEIFALDTVLKRHKGLRILDLYVGRAVVIDLGDRAVGEGAHLAFIVFKNFLFKQPLDVKI